MGLVFAMAAVMWGIGAMLAAPKSARWAMILLLYLAVVGIHVLLPQGHVLRVKTGGEAELWYLIGGFGAIVALYRWGLSAVRARAKPAPIVADDKFSDTELDRYARHIMLRDIGGMGQKRLRDAHVLVVGAGGLGAPALMYLAAAGVGRITVVDGDRVENSNLQRQIIHMDRAINTPKAISAADMMRAQNPFVTVVPKVMMLEDATAPDLLADVDIVLDGTDNFKTRYLVNAACVAAGVPLVSGALSPWEGQIGVFHPASGAPCYQCVFPKAPAADLVPSCAEAGVVAPLPGVIGSMMALEAIKWIAGAGAPLSGSLLIYDALWAETRKIAVKPAPDCACCGG